MVRIGECRRLRSIIGLSLIAGFGCGCHSLSGTTWAVTQISPKAEADLAEVEDIQSVLVHFSSDGQLETTVRRKDGKVEKESDEKYEELGKFILIRHPNYERRIAYKRVGDSLQLSSERYDATLERSVPKVADRPALFRPSTVGDRTYKRIVMRQRAYRP